MTFLIVLIALILIAIVLFFTWFATAAVKGKCPICALKKFSMPRKITMDISEFEDYDNNACKTPPMGWSSWNTFRNHIDEDLIYETAEAMVYSGLKEAGYQYVNIDDCWQSSMRDSDGKLQADLGTFSHGMPELIKRVNKLGLKVGLYSSNGTHTCEDMPASLGNEELDAKTLASWGCEFFKYDFCHKKTISGNCPPIECIELNNLNGNEFNSKLTLKPEDATLTGRAKVIDIKELPTGKAIGYLNHGAGTASFEINNMPQGEYCLTIVYKRSFTRKEQYVQVIVNGKMHEVFFPYGNGFSDNGRVQIIIKLNQEVNTIKLQNPVATMADSSFIQYKRMGDALKNATSLWAKITNSEEKPIVYSICEWGTAMPWHWGNKAGNMWRTTMDIFPNWKRIIMIYNRTIGLYEHGGVGHFNDPDMLEVGNGKLTNEENKAHFSLWCMMAAPLMLGNDIRKFVSANMPDVENETLKIVTNKHLIAVDQDSLCKSAKRLGKIGSVDVLARPLANGDVALCLFNKGGSAKSIKYDLKNLANDEYLGLTEASSYAIHNLWNDERETGSAISTHLAKHGVSVYRIKAE